MAKFRSVVIHVNHVDVNINGVLNLVAVQVDCMSSQLEKKDRNIVCRFQKAREISAVKTTNFSFYKCCVKSDERT